MKFFLLLFALSVSIECKSQKVKILIDQVQPISGNRIIGTDAISVFKMKLIKIAAIIEISIDTTNYTIAYYTTNLNISIDTKIDSSKWNSIILLADGTKVIGKYKSTTDAMGLKIISYNFSSIDFQKIAAQDAKAYTISTVTGVGEYLLEDKLKSNFKIICKTALEKINR